MAEFRCHHCGYDVTTLVDDRPTPPAAVCPECGKFSAFGSDSGGRPPLWVSAPPLGLALVATFCFAMESTPNRGDWGFPPIAYLFVPVVGLCNGGLTFVLWMMHGAQTRERQRAAGYRLSSRTEVVTMATVLAAVAFGVTVLCTGWAVSWATGR